MDINENYKIGKLLNSGTHGIIKLATHKRSGQKRAVKIYRKNMLTNELWQQREKSISYMRSMEGHPGIVKLFDILQDEQYYYIVSELCEGQELYGWLLKNKGKITEDRARFIMN